MAVFLGAGIPVDASSPLGDRDSAESILRVLGFDEAPDSIGQYSNGPIAVELAGAPDLSSVTLHAEYPDGADLSTAAQLPFLLLAFAGERGAALVERKAALSPPESSFTQD